MLNTRSLKKKGIHSFYRNWKSCIIICFVFTILVGGTVISVTKNIDVTSSEEAKYININHTSGESNSDVVNEFLKGVGKEPHVEEKLFKSTNGVIASILNNVSKSGSFLFGVLNAINQGLFKDRIWASVIIIVGAVILLIYWIFVSKVLEVGKSRFFLENRIYTKTKANKLIIPYKLNNTMNVAKTMFIKNLYTLLWSITIIGPIIKFYDYYLVPCILAENPNMKTRDILRLSKSMMKHHRWKVFKINLSFIGWDLLGLITLNISNLIYTNPYKNATDAEIYMSLRDMAREENIYNSDLLNDRYLEGSIVFDEYPIYEYMFRSSKERSNLNINYKRDYSLFDLILIFFAISLLGWIWEVVLHLFQTGTFVNRGTLHGPWLPIYGAGSIAMLVLLKKARKNPFLYFALSMLVCGIIEYGTSLYLEINHGMKWWDYTGFFLNINGRICLEGLIVFGVGGLAVTYALAPFIANFLDKINKKVKVILCIVLTSLIACDFLYSGAHPNDGEGVAKEVESKIT